MSKTTQITDHANGGSTFGAPLSPHEEHDFREAIRRILDSSTFTGSRRLSDFLIYVTNAAIEGRDSIDQYEIAENVLHRQEDFNPLDDASVRKVASQVRSKLEEYFSGEGVGDKIVVSLPRRSYLPRFRYREGLGRSHFETETTDNASEQDVANERAIDEQGALASEADSTGGRSAAPKFAAGRMAIVGQWRSLIRHRFPVAFAVAVGGAAVILVTAAVSFHLGSQNEVASLAKGLPGEAGRFEVETQRGDLRFSVGKVAPGAVLLGPVIGPYSDAFARIRFAPKHSGQQAGVMAFWDPDNFIRLGRHLKTRTMTEFGIEMNGQYIDRLGQFAYDSLGQVSLPKWFSIRRENNQFTAFSSFDGFHWEQYGSPQRMNESAKDPRVAIYAFNGWTDILSTVAVFDHVGTGISFHNREETVLQPGSLLDWQIESSCPEAVDARITKGALVVNYAAEAVGCTWGIFRKPPEGNWTYTAVFDFMPVSGSAAGLALAGEKDFLSVTRRDLNGTSIMLQRKGDMDVSVPDLPGSPLLFVRLSKRDGVISGSYSADGEQFVSIGDGVIAQDLGTLHRIGFETNIAHWTSINPRPPIRLYRIVQDAETMESLQP